MAFELPALPYSTTALAAAGMVQYPHSHIWAAAVA